MYALILAEKCLMYFSSFYLGIYIGFSPTILNMNLKEFKVSFILKLKENIVRKLSVSKGEENPVKQLHSLKCKSLFMV